MPTKADKGNWKPKRPKEEAPNFYPPATGDEITKFDIDKLNIVSLANNLSSAISRPAPKTWIGRWFQSRRIELDQQRIDSVCSYIETIKKINQDVTQVQAELKVAPAILELIVQGNLLKAQQEVELQAREHYERVQEINDRAEARRLQLDRLNAEIGAITAKIDSHHVDNAIKHALADKIKELPLAGAEIANIINSLKGNTDITDDLVMLNQKIEMAKAEIGVKIAEKDLKDAQAEQEKVQAESSRHTFDTTKARYK